MFRTISRLSIAITLTLLSSVIPAASQTAAPATAAPLTQTENTHTYDILISTAETPPTTKVSVELPKTWGETIGNDGAPNFSAPGISGSFGITGMLVGFESDDAARIEKLIGMHFYGVEANLIREQLPDGRVWVSSPDPKSTHVRLYIPMDGRIIMGFAMVDKMSDEKVAEVRAVFETIRQAAP